MTTEIATTIGAVESAGSVRRSPSITHLAVAMAKAQAEMRNPPKDSVNPHFKNRYADLATVRAAVVPVMLAHGLTVMQFPCDLDGDPALTTLLVHQSGEWVETAMRLRPTKADPQGVGSALTYLRRYSLLAITGLVADDDDDGNAAGRPQPQQQRQPQRPQTPAQQPKPLPPARDNSQLVRDFQQAYENCPDLPTFDSISQQVKADRRNHVLTDADCDAIRAVAVRVNNKLRAEQPQAAA